MAETNLSQTVGITGDACSYDTNVKYLLADRQVLARILKYALGEFKDMPIDEIMGCIGDDIEIGTKPVDPGMTNLGRISGANTEDNVPGEGKIFFDIRFSAYHKQNEIKILVNVEAQRSSDPKKLGYHLENRIIFYLARMISAQKQTEFYHSDYDSLKKVRSIWICMDNGEDGDSIEEIALERKAVFGNADAPYDMDLMKGIIVNIRNSDNVKESKNILISMLEKLLSQMDADDKKRDLAEKYGMIMTEELEGRMNTMCNLSQLIVEEGMKKGREQGIKQGREQGIKQGREQGIKQGIEQGREQGIKQGREQGIEQERINAIKRMLKADAAKAQIILFGYTEDEIAKAQSEV